MATLTPATPIPLQPKTFLPPPPSEEVSGHGNITVLKNLSLKCRRIVGGLPLASVVILRSTSFLMGFRSTSNACLTIWKSESSVWSCCFARNRRNADPTSVTTEGIGAAAVCAETLGPVCGWKYCERSFWLTLFCGFRDSKVSLVCWCG